LATFHVSNASDICIYYVCCQILSKILNCTRYKGNEESFNKFVDALASNKTCKKLDLGNNKIGASGAEKIAYALKINNTLQVLDLKTNAIGPKGAQKLADALKVNKSLRELNLWYNGIKKGCVAIGEALKTNRSLETLDLGNNKIGAISAERIAEALKENVTLQNLKSVNAAFMQYIMI